MRYPHRLAFTPALPLLLAFAIGSSSVLRSQTATTLPVGAIRIEVAAGTPATPAVTAFAIPLTTLETAPGIPAGRIVAFSSNTVTVRGANWSPAALARPDQPYAIRILTGRAAGEWLPISGNTADTLIVSSSNLREFGLTAGSGGDIVEVVRIHTLDSLFGANTFTGGATADTADIIRLGSQLQESYYFNTTAGQWRRSSGRSTANAGATVIPPHATLHVTRRGAALALTFTGRVPSSPFRIAVANAGNTYTHTGYPTDVTLGEFALERRVANWVSSTSPEFADKISLPASAGWRTFYHNGADWIDLATHRATPEAVTIPFGTPIVIARPGSSVGFSTLARPLPYSLQP